MTRINTSDDLTNLTDLLRETFEGTGGQSSHSIDGKGHDHASTPLSDGGATIAAHTEHARSYIQILRRLIANENNVQADWPASWRTRPVTAEDWDVLRKAIRDEYAAVTAHISRTEVWNDVPIGGFLSILAHSAYYLGAIRLLAVTLRVREGSRIVSCSPDEFRPPA